MNKEEWITFYYKQGWNIIPARERKKSPALPNWKRWQNIRVDEKTLDYWIKKDMFHNINLCLGSISGIWEIDVDVKNVPIGLILSNYRTNEVWVCESSNGKCKLFFKSAIRLPPKLDTRVNKQGEHVELRGDNHLSVLPPSIHPTGAIYKWVMDVKNNKLIEIDGKKLYDSIISIIRAENNYHEEKKKVEYQDEGKHSSGVRDLFWRSYERGTPWNNSEGHSFRLAFAAELINNGYSDAQIHIFFKTHDKKSGEDYSRSITQKKIDELRRKKMHCWKYDTLIQHCPDLIEE